MKTPDEALKCLCPYSRRQKDGEEGFYVCEADECMMWRWERKMNRDCKTKSDVLNAKCYSMESTGRGYCGLAGKP